MTIQYRAILGDRLSDFYDTPEEACRVAYAQGEVGTDTGEAVHVLTVGEPFVGSYSEVTSYTLRWVPDRTKPATAPPAPPPPPAPPTVWGERVRLDEDEAPPLRATVQRGATVTHVGGPAPELAET